MWIGKILRKKSVIQLQFIWEHIYWNKEVTILKKAEKGILCLLSDLQNGVNTGAKRSWRRNKMFSMRHVCSHCNWWRKNCCRFRMIKRFWQGVRSFGCPFAVSTKTTRYNKQISAYKAHKQYYNELAQKVIDFCKSKGINYHIKSKTITE